jgi:acetoacetyl-CoA synthetase
MVEAGFSAARAFTARRGVRGVDLRTQAAVADGGIPAAFRACATDAGKSSAKRVRGAQQEAAEKCFAHAASYPVGGVGGSDSRRLESGKKLKGEGKKAWKIPPEGCKPWQPSAATIRAARITPSPTGSPAERGLRFADYDALVALVGRRPRSFLGRRLGLLRDSVRDAAHRRVLGRCPDARRRMVPRRQSELRRSGLPPCDDRSARPSSRATKPAIDRELGWAELQRQVGALAASLRAHGRAARRPRGRLPAQHSRDRGRLPRRGQHRRHLVGLLARHGAHRRARPLPPDRAQGDDRRRRLPLRRQAARPPRTAARTAGRTAQRRAPGTAALPRPAADPAGFANCTAWAAAIAGDAPLQVEHVPFDHPLWVVYSSGTTGLPKPIVHSQGGIVVEHVKLGALHLDLGPETASTGIRAAAGSCGTAR